MSDPPVSEGDSLLFVSPMRLFLTSLLRPNALQPGDIEEDLVN